jgi:hypothetical protein
MTNRTPEELAKHLDAISHRFDKPPSPPKYKPMVRILPANVVDLTLYKAELIDERMRKRFSKDYDNF